MPENEQRGEEETEATSEQPREIQILEKVREDFDWESYLDEYNVSTPVLVETDPKRESPSFDHRLTLTNTLHEHLIWQMRLLDMTASNKKSVPSLSAT